MPSLNLSRVRFTNQADQVESYNGIFTPKNSNVNTLNGDDEIIGKTSVSENFGAGIIVDVASEDSNSIIVAADVVGKNTIATDGIKNKGIINTGNGADKIVGMATANLSAIAMTLSQATAIAETTNTAVITDTFASIKLTATADGIDNSDAEIHTGNSSDYIYGVAEASIAAVAIADANASAIVDAFAETPKPENLIAFAEAIATSLAQASIIARGINNTQGTITTGNGDDYISAKATSSASTFSSTFAGTLATASPENQALAVAVANAFAKAEDQAIAIDNNRGTISTGNGSDHIKAIAEAGNKAIAIDNNRGTIFTGNDDDNIEAIAEAGDKAIAINNNRGTIFTGNGSDHIEAIAEAGDKAIAIDNNRGEIITGNGNDTIIAKATGSESYGIFGGNIYMGDGVDKLEASSFGSGVNINMGKGNDFVAGFGYARINGGAGLDTLSLGAYKIEDFNISLGANNNQVILTLDGITMITTNFEQFNFDNGNSTIKYDDLVLVV